MRPRMSPAVLESHTAILLKRRYKDERQTWTKLFTRALSFVTSSLVTPVGKLTLRTYGYMGSVDIKQA